MRAPKEKLSLGVQSDGTPGGLLGERLRESHEALNRKLHPNPDRTMHKLAIAALAPCALTAALTAQSATITSDWTTRLVVNSVPLHEHTLATGTAYGIGANEHQSFSGPGSSISSDLIVQPNFVRIATTSSVNLLTGPGPSIDLTSQGEILVMIPAGRGRLHLEGRSHASGGPSGFGTIEVDVFDDGTSEFAPPPTFQSPLVTFDVLIDSAMDIPVHVTVDSQLFGSTVLDEAFANVEMTWIPEEITMYVAPQASDNLGRFESGFVDALGPGQTLNTAFSPISQPTGSPPTASEAGFGYVVEYRHRDDAGGALSGAYRGFDFFDFNTLHGVDRGMRSSGGTAAAPDMLEISFSQPIGHWGADMLDLESYTFDSATLRAYDSDDVMLYEADIIYPNQEDGENATNNATNFVGIISETNNIRKITITVGNTAAASTGGLPNNENVHSIGMLDMFFGDATKLPGHMRTTFSNSNFLFSGGTIYFDLDCTAAAGVTMNALDLNFGDAPGTSGSVDIYLSGDAGATWTLVSTGTVANAAGPGLPTRATLSTPIPLGANCGFRMAIVSQGLGHVYSNTANFPLVWSNNELTLGGGYSTGSPFGGQLFTPRVPNITFHYSNGGQCALAKVESIGDGCVARTSSIYERFGDATDFGGVLFYPQSDGSVQGFTTSDTFAPVGNLAPPTQLVLGDDDQVVVGSFGLVVGSNGWVARGGGNTNVAVPSEALLLSNPSTAFYAWKDLDPSVAGSGKVFYEELAFAWGSMAWVTFDGTFAWNTSDPHKIQFRMEFDLQGEMTLLVIITDTVSSSGSDILIGYSPGGPSPDLGSTDLTAGNFATEAPESASLQLDAIGTPKQGHTANVFQVVASDIPSSALLHMGHVGLTNPNLPLQALGMPGCSLYATLDVIVGPQIPVGSSVTWSPLTLPALPVNFAGFEFYVQSTVLGTNQNAAFGTGALTSNGVRCTVGSL